MWKSGPERGLKVYIGVSTSQGGGHRTRDSDFNLTEGFDSDEEVRRVFTDQDGPIERFGVEIKSVMELNR